VQYGDSLNRYDMAKNHAILHKPVSVTGPKIFGIYSCLSKRYEIQYRFYSILLLSRGLSYELDLLQLLNLLRASYVISAGRAKNETYYSIIFRQPSDGVHPIVNRNYCVLIIIIMGVLVMS